MSTHRWANRSICSRLSIRPNVTLRTEQVGVVRRQGSKPQRRAVVLPDLQKVLQCQGVLCLREGPVVRRRQWYCGVLLFSLVTS